MNPNNQPNNQSIYIFVSINDYSEILIFQWLFLEIFGFLYLMTYQHSWFI